MTTVQVSKFRKYAHVIAYCFLYIDGNQNIWTNQSMTGQHTNINILKRRRQNIDLDLEKNQASMTHFIDINLSFLLRIGFVSLTENFKPSQDQPILCFLVPPRQKCMWFFIFHYENTPIQIYWKFYYKKKKKKNNNNNNNNNNKIK